MTQVTEKANDAVKRRWWVDALLVLLVAMLAACGLNAVTGQRPLTDSGIFAGAGLHLAHGKALYRDVWDHKPPMIFLLNAAAIAVRGEDIDAIRTMERLFGAAAAMALFGIIRLGTGSRLAATLAALLLPIHLYRPGIFEGGNLTEEYALAFTLVGVLCVVAAKLAKRRRALLLCGGAGVFFALACLTKEPFLLSALPWVVYLVVGKAWWKRAAACLVGGLLPLAGVLLYLHREDALSDWLEVIWFGMAYAQATGGETSWIERLAGNVPRAATLLFGSQTATALLVVTGAFAGVISSGRRTLGWLPTVALAALLAEYVGTCLSARQFGHYYMQLLCAGMILAGCGVVVWQRSWANAKWRLPAGVLAGMFMVILATDWPSVTEHVRDVFSFAPQTEVGVVSAYIREHSDPDDTIWTTSSSVSRYYIETGRLAPVKYIFIEPHLFVDTPSSTGQEKQAALLTGLRQGRPKFLVRGLADRPLLEGLGLLDWIETEYVRVRGVSDEDPYGRPGRVQLWQRK